MQCPSGCSGIAAGGSGQWRPESLGVSGGSEPGLGGGERAEGRSKAKQARDARQAEEGRHHTTGREGKLESH